MHLRPSLKSGPLEGATLSVEESPETKSGNHQIKPKRKSFSTAETNGHKLIKIVIAVGVPTAHPIQ